MILFFSVALSSIIAVFGSVILNYGIDAFRSQSYAYCRQIVESNIGLMDTYFSQMKDVSMIIANDADVIEAVNYRNGTQKADYGKELYYQRRVTDKMKQIDVLGNVETSLIVGNRYQCLYYYGISPKKNYNFKNQKWFLDAIRQDGYTAHFTGYHDTDYLLSGTHGKDISIITPILNTSQYATTQAAYFLCDFQLSSVISGARPGSNVSIAVYDGRTPIYFPNGIRLTNEQKNRLSESLAEGQRSFTLEAAAAGSPAYLVVNQTSKISGWSILGLMPLTEIDSLRFSVTSFVVAAILISIGAVVALSSLISKSILIPIDRLVSSFNQIARGKTDVSFRQSGSREVNLLARTAKEMLERINLLSRDLIQKQKQFSQEQLKVLQHQINPHFLNNTLQSIKSLAVAGNMDAVSRMATLLGRLLSYSVYEPFGKVPLSEELQYAKNYIILQKARYPNIDYSVDCEDTVRDVPVPKLIVQPLVENAIEHGLPGNRKGHISVCAEADEGEIHLIVSDSGTGFSEEKKKEVMARLQKGDSGSASGNIGLLNVHKRIQSIYGKPYGISILSRSGMNTSVIITIPRREEEKC
jgi:two-component system sensor histidine kinase YesM